MNSKLTIKEAILLNCDPPGYGNFNRDQLVTAAMWQLGPETTVKRKSIVDTITRMLKDCEIQEWTSREISLP
jgi:hypothetical protein